MSAALILDPGLVAAAAHERWAAACPACARPRILWPIGQNVNSGREAHATYVHRNGKEECSG